MLSSSVGAELVQFFLNHLSDIFIVPRSIRQKVAFRLYQVKTGIMEIVSGEDLNIFYSFKKIYM